MCKTKAHILEITIQLLIPNSHSLKDKRSIVKSLIKRIQNQFSISVAESGFQEMWQRAKLTLVLVSLDMKLLNDNRQKIEIFVHNKLNSFYLHFYSSRKSFI